MPATSPFLMSLPRQIKLRAGEVPVRVRMSPRARRLALRIDAQAEAVELVLPRRTSARRAMAFIEENRNWLDKRITALPPRTLLADGATVPLLDKPYRIRRVELARDRQHAWIADGEIHVAASPEQLSRRLIEFLKEMARGEFHRRADALSARIGRKVGRISVRDTTTRWGSCSANGNLAFSWRLIMAPDAVLEYVVAHEVAHLAEMNHSKRFWKLVEKLAPGVDGQRHWLNRHRARLLRIG
jgi:predicted metal-dependent hydrolase